MDEYVDRILNIANSNCKEKDIKDDIQDDLDLIFELYYDKNDIRLHGIYLKYNIQNYSKLIYGKKINTYI